MASETIESVAVVAAGQKINDAIMAAAVSDFCSEMLHLLGYY